MTHQFTETLWVPFNTVPDALPPCFWAHYRKDAIKAVEQAFGQLWPDLYRKGFRIVKMQITAKEVK